MWKDFKAFLLKNNIIALALAVVVGAATNELVQAFVALTPQLSRSNPPPDVDALAEAADIIVLDDAFQHRRAARDADVVLIDAGGRDDQVLGEDDAGEIYVVALNGVVSRIAGASGGGATSSACSRSRRSWSGSCAPGCSRSR